MMVHSHEYNCFSLKGACGECAETGTLHVQLRLLFQKTVEQKAKTLCNIKKLSEICDILSA